MDNLTQNESEPTYKTSDLRIIAFLLAMNCTYLRALKSPDDREVVFVHFSNPSKCQKLEREFFSKNPKVPVKDIINGLNNAKDIIFREKRRVE